ncbi:MAG: MBL fold metallo-hydrolase [Smithellaceae bacterium]|nr:MBL fold metallo-hydrolase [Smithellaceae bacterium]
MRANDGMFRTTLINDASGDPGVYLEFRYLKQAILFDLGDLHRLRPRQLLKLGHIFVSHTHMDHFIGFDHLLRICLGRDMHLHLYGPQGFLSNVASRLGAYNWNLVNNYTNDFTIFVTEISKTECRTRSFSCRDAFQVRGETHSLEFNGLVVAAPHFTVRADFLDHGIPCLAFRFEETDRINIRKNVLEEMALPKGKWLMELKDHVAAGRPPDFPVRIYWREDNREIRERWMPLGELQDRLIVIKTGQSLCYVTDVLGNGENAERIMRLARGVGILYIEAPFLHEDLVTARKKMHLTARQAGALARMAGVKRLCLFHFSPKYKGAYPALEEEAAQAFAGSGPPVEDGFF